jgi:hypothetical protein
MSFTSLTNAGASIVNSRPILPRVLIVPALLALLIAAWAGLVRIGWSLPPLAVSDHGSLMISGFLGTLIALERAVALTAASPRNRWAFAVPLVSALGAAGILLGAPRVLSIGLIAAASAGMVTMFLLMLRHHLVLHAAIMTLGAVCWLVGNLLWWSGQPVFQIVEWWVAFLVWTIAGERLELSRIMRPPPFSRKLFMALTVVYLAGLILVTAQIAAGTAVVGLSMIGLGHWLLRYDLARRTIRQRGLTRFIAAALLAGYGWLIVSGLLRLVYGEQLAGPYYDAQLHTVLVGFAFSMIFGHAPIILPAVLRVTIGYSPALYLPLALLHAGLAVRVAGDLTLNMSLRAWGGMLNVVAILLYFGMIAASVWLARRRRLVTLAA